MKVKELREALESYGDDQEVHFAYPAGDYWRTTLAPTVGQVDERYVRRSGYHDEDAVVDDEDANKDGVRLVVVLLS